jgi:eukaryotic-like serine/threonine-protein kinase
MIKTKRCQYCGKETPSDAPECTHCRGAFHARPGVAVLDHFAAVKSALSDKYEIVAEIGHGGNATVYQAIQKNLDRKVALKVLLPGLVSDPGYMERFHFEARAIAKLRHPNIVTIYDVGSEQGIHYMAMEFLEGKDLHHLVKGKGVLQIREAVEMAKCIAGALDYAHSYGIIHRDVKSSNIIMSATRSAVLTDFGIAQSGVTTVHTKSGTLLGTPEFMSPEQAGGKPIDARTDFYSLGVVLYHTLSGHYPFQGESPITTIHKILYERPVPLGQLVRLPFPLEQAISKCLAKDPDERVRSGKELIALLTPDAYERPPRSAEIATPRTAGIPLVRPVELPAPETGEQVIPGGAPRTSGISRNVDHRRPSFRTVVIATVACLAFTGYVAWQRLPATATDDKSEQTAPAPLPARRLVPYLVGATKDEAIRLLKREGFAVGNVSVVAVPDSAKRGKVDSQHPAHGSSAKPGTTVDLLIGE